MFGFLRKEVAPAVGWGVMLAVFLGIGQFLVDKINHPDYEEFLELATANSLNEAPDAKDLAKEADLRETIGNSALESNFFLNGNLYALVAAAAGGAGIRFASRNR